MWARYQLIHRSDQPSAHIWLHFCIRPHSNWSHISMLHLSGNVTKHLCKAFPNARITGVDSSPQMIEAARNEFKNYPQFADRVDFKLDTVENYVCTNNSEKYDIVYSNATLHWIPTSYHSVLLPQIINNIMKKNNSILAIQMPDTKNQQSHLLMETG